MIALPGYGSCFYSVRFAKKRSGDLISGIFGTAPGYNFCNNIFLCALAICGVHLFIMNRRHSVLFFISFVLIGISVATISELKAFYIELILIILAAIVITKPNRRAVAMVIVASAGLLVSIPVLYRFYPSFRNFFNIDTIVKYAASSGYSNGENLNRVTAIPTLASMFFKSHPFQLLFGIGPGSGEYSQIVSLISRFYRLYGEGLDYTWFSDAYIFLENGLLELLEYIGFSLPLLSYHLKSSTGTACHFLIARLLKLLPFFPSFIFFTVLPFVPKVADILSFSFSRCRFPCCVGKVLGSPLHRRISPGFIGSTIF